MDVLTPSLISTTTTTATEPPPPPAPEVAAAAPPPVDDPFASAGLLSGITDSTLDGLMTDSTFQFRGQKLIPLEMDTFKFGAQWGTTPASSSISQLSPKILNSNLQNLLDILLTAGLHNVETIAATNEAICAGMMGGAASHITLVHAKLHPPNKIDLTVKATDQELANTLSLYFQNMLR